MWEYAVLHQRDNGWAVAFGEGLAKWYIEVVFENPIKRGWDKRADTAIGDSKSRKKSIRKPAKDRIWWLYGEKTWNSENPLWKTPKPSLIDYAKKWNRKFPPHFIEIFGVNPTHATAVFDGMTEPLFEAPTVVQVLNMAGQEGWELVGTVPSGTNRMLRRSL